MESFYLELNANLHRKAELALGQRRSKERSLRLQGLQAFQDQRRLFKCGFPSKQDVEALNQRARSVCFGIWCNKHSLPPATA